MMNKEEFNEEIQEMLREELDKYFNFIGLSRKITDVAFPYRLDKEGETWFSKQHVLYLLKLVQFEGWKSFDVTENEFGSIVLHRTDFDDKATHPTISGSGQYVVFRASGDKTAYP